MPFQESFIKSEIMGLEKGGFEVRLIVVILLIIAAFFLIMGAYYFGIGLEDNTPDENWNDGVMITSVFGAPFMIIGILIFLY